jgi:hypothetical protein
VKLDADGVSVLYILGWGRSGSTILDNLLGSIDGFFSAGELHYIWERGLIEGRKCGCGERIVACELWSSALRAGWGGPEEIDAEDLVRAQRRWARVRATRRLLRRTTPEGDASLERLVASTGRLYRAVAQVTGARVIVDSSKRPSNAGLLRLVPGVTAYFVHLVRDPRAVAYSWWRRKEQPDRGHPAELVRHGPVDSTLSWVRWNLAAEEVRRRSDRSRSLLVRYEDLMASPQETLCDIAALVGESPEALPLASDGVATLASNHTVSGNPSRFTTGVVKLREDTDWITRQSVRDRIVVTSLALPLLRRYGYSLQAPHPTGALVA